MLESHIVLQQQPRRRSFVSEGAIRHPINCQAINTPPMQTNTKACRNCGSTERYSKEVYARGAYGPDLLPVGGFFNPPKFRLFVCGGCGLAEWFVQPEFLSKVKERFKREG